jgi:hypothetical protein
MEKQPVKLTLTDHKNKQKWQSSLTSHAIVAQFPYGTGKIDAGFSIGTAFEPTIKTLIIKLKK